MRKVLRSVSVDGEKYPVLESPRGLKAHLYGINGWTKVYAENYTQLVRRVRFALRDPFGRPGEPK